MSKQYFIDNINDEALARLTESMLKIEKNNVNIRRENNMLKILSTAAVIVLMIGLVSFIGLFNILDDNFSGTDSTMVITSEPVEENQDNQNQIELFLPEIVEKSFFENRVLACITNPRDVDKINAYYKLRDASDVTLTERARKELLAEYPTCDKVPIYAFDPNASEREKDSMLEIFRKYVDFTDEDILKMWEEYNIPKYVAINGVYCIVDENYTPIAETEITDYITIKGERYSIQEKMLQLCHLRTTNADIEPLKYMVNLQRLNLNDIEMLNPISDISPLAGLTNLTFLGLGGNKIEDISPLTNLTNLTELSLWNNKINDISPLKGLTNLNWLGLSQNQISDISPLAGLTNLTVLNLGTNQINDINPLAGLTYLTRLALVENQISDISALAKLMNLTDLDLYDNNINDIKPLAGLTELRKLDLYRNNINDISALAGLTNLTELNLTLNQINDINPLAGLTNLTKLSLTLNQVTDISALAELTKLTELHLYDNNINDISALAELTNLTVLSLENNNISDISALAKLTNLTVLNLINNKINEINVLKGLTNLTQLGLAGNQISAEQIAELREALPNTEIWAD